MIVRQTPSTPAVRSTSCSVMWRLPLRGPRCHPIWGRWLRSKHRASHPVTHRRPISFGWRACRPEGRSGRWGFSLCWGSCLACTCCGHRRRGTNPRPGHRSVQPRYPRRRLRALMPKGCPTPGWTTRPSPLRPHPAQPPLVSRPPSRLGLGHHESDAGRSPSHGTPPQSHRRPRKRPRPLRSPLTTGPFRSHRPSRPALRLESWPPASWCLPVSLRRRRARQRQTLVRAVPWKHRAR